VDYILTGYQLPKEEGKWFIAEVYFDLKDIKVEGDTLYFSLEVPQIAKYGGQLEIDYLDISLGTKEALEKTKIQQEEQTDEQAEKKNIIQRIKEWTENQLNGVKTKVNQVKSWFKDKYSQIFKKKDKDNSEKDDKTDEDKGFIIVKSSPSPTPSPLPSPSPIQKITTLIKVLNGGASKGGAGEFAKVLESAGFTNVIADNADKEDYKNAIIRYRIEDEKTASKLEDLLKKDYKIIDKQKIATTSAGIVVIIGEK
ncbi:LytR C-terminal domain-containing protein, partial [Patescibacteria group bacterium]|nr:LytR C-terminal domain-containing protein [Patescibacteria group bacterium]